MDSVFFEGKINDKLKNKCNETYLYYFCVKELYDSESLYLERLYKRCDKEFGNCIKKIAFKDYVLSKFYDDNMKISLFNRQRNDYEQLSIYREYFEQYDKLSKNQLIEEISDGKRKKFIKYLALIHCYYRKCGFEYKFGDYISTALNMIENHDMYYRRFQASLHRFKDTHENSHYIIYKKEINEILKLCNVKYINNLTDVGIDMLLAIFSLDNESFVESLNIGDDNETEKNIYNELDKIFNDIEPRSLEIFKMRKGLLGSKIYTLAECGERFEITRERARQIESKTNRYLEKCYIESNIDLYLNNMYSKLSNNRSIKYIPIYTFLNDIKPEKYKDYLELLLFNCSSNLFYSRRYQIIVDSDETDIDELIHDAYNALPDHIMENDFDKYNHLEKMIITNDFKNNGKGLFTKKGISSTNVIENEIIELFPNGYRIGSVEDYELLKNNIENKYGDKVNVPSFRAIQGYIGRKEFCLIDKGTFLSKNKTVEIPENLVKKIVQYIKNKDDVVYYISIYNEFKKELNDFGINNRYYLKGLLDDKLPKDIITKRDYLSFSGNFTTPTQAIINAVEQYKKEFTFDDLEKRFPGVKDYTFLQTLSPLEDLIWITNRSAIFKNCLNPSVELIKTIEEEIEYCFNLLKTNTIFAGKVYSRMIIMHKDLMNEIPMINNPTAFCNFIKAFIENEYFYIRNYISKDNVDNVSRIVLIEDYVKSLEIFTNSDVKKYCDKMNISGLYSYLEFMISMSDEFVQIDKDACVSKKIFNISVDQLEFIKRELIYHIDSFGEIDTRSYNIFGTLPKLARDWNKHLLVGIIRTYLNNYFEIEYTEKQYDKTDYIIRRI